MVIPPALPISKQYHKKQMGGSSSTIPVKNHPNGNGDSAPLPAPSSRQRLVRVREKYALRIVLVSDRSIDYLATAPAMECIAKRLTGNCHLEPLTIDETSDYLYAKMRQGGCIDRLREVIGVRPWIGIQADAQE